MKSALSTILRHCRFSEAWSLNGQVGGKWYFSTLTATSSYRAVTMPYTLYCAIIGRNDNDIFPIHINETQTVGELKHEIKKKAETTGSAHNLKLYKVDINISDDDDDDDDETFNVSTNYKQVMEKISQNTTYTQEIQDLSTKPKQVLTNPLRKLSAIFRKSPPCVDETIHILVELPPGESIDSIDPRVWCVAETSRHRIF